MGVDRCEVRVATASNQSHSLPSGGDSHHIPLSMNRMRNE